MVLIDVLKLRNNFVSSISIDATLELDLNSHEHMDILEISPVHVTGSIEKNALEELIAPLHIEGTMTLPCAITLKPVLVPFSIDVEDALEEMWEESTKNPKKSENVIDFLPIIWENILSEVPIRVVSEEANSTSLGECGIRIISEQEKAENPALQELAELLNKKEV